jgi:hypothetical protein
MKRFALTLFVLGALAVAILPAPHHRAAQVGDARGDDRDGEGKPRHQ